MRTLGGFIAAAMLSATAAPAATLLDYGTLVASTSEDFEGHPVGPLAESAQVSSQLIFVPPDQGDRGPFAFNGFTVASAYPIEPSVSDEAPCRPADKCLALFVSSLFDQFVGAPAPVIAGVFSGFADGTTAFGLHLLGDHPAFTIIARGEGETTFALDGSGGPAGTRVAVHDPLGLREVEIQGVQYIDNVVTSQVAPIPLPPAGALLFAAVAGLAAARRAVRRRVAPVRG